MYVTAHRVTKDATGETGINAFLFRHGSPRPLVTDNWTQDQVDNVTYQNPGILVKQKLNVSAGSNMVLSYLDIIAPDGTSSADIQKALKIFEHDLGTDAFPMLRVVNGMAIRLGLVCGLTGKEELEFGALQQAVTGILAE